MQVFFPNVLTPHDIKCFNEFYKHIGLNLDRIPYQSSSSYLRKFMSEAKSEVIYGRWAALETLRAARREIHQLVLAEGIEEKSIISDLIAAAQHGNVSIKRIPRRMMDDIAKGGGHQGVVLRVGPYPYADVETMLALADDRKEKPFLLILDLLQ